MKTKLTFVLAVIIATAICTLQKANAQWSLTGNAGTNPASNFLGTTDSKALVFRTSNKVRMRIMGSGTNIGYVGIGVSSPVQKLDVNGNINMSAAYGLYIDNKRVLSINGTGNFFAGENAGKSNTDGSYNTAIGTQSLSYNSSGVFNTASGFGALAANNGNYNTANGSYALNSNTSGAANTAHGYEALYLNTTGESNTACGYKSLFFNTTGLANTANGDNALYSNTTGSLNTANGENSLYSNTTGAWNTANGNSSLFSNTEGLYNTANGSSALYLNTVGGYNTAVGRYALYSNKTGSDNTANGAYALYYNTGDANTAIGTSALQANTTGSYNTAIGYNANVSSGNLSNTTAIGFSAQVNASNTFVLGNSSVNKWGFGHNAAVDDIIDFANTTAKLTNTGVWTNASDKKLKENFEKQNSKSILEKVNQLQINKWNYKVDKNRKYIGPVARDFHNLFGVGDDSTISTIDPSGIALLAIQELSRQNDSLKERLDKIEQMLAANNALQGSVANAAVSSVQLEQNNPNPFANATSIRYNLPVNFKSAQIVITGANGKNIKQVQLNTSGRGVVNISAYNLGNGSYTYSLVVDGKIAESKKMVVER